MSELSTADRERSLVLDDLERLAIAARMSGHSEDAWAALARAFQEALRTDDHARAAKLAFQSGMEFQEVGQHARAQGWFARGEKLVREHELDGAERGYLLLPHALAAMAQGDMPRALELLTEADAIGERARDRDLVALARHARGRALIHLARVTEGLPLLDEAMTSVTAGEVSPLLTGIVYCSVIEACNEMYELRRAREWTAALSRWCEEQPGLVPFRGPCLVYRAELMRLHGDWPDAMAEAERARETVASVAGAAWYEQAELHRLRGEHAEADRAFRAASAEGRSPQPGLALLRLAQGRVDAAAAAMRQAIDETHGPLARSRLLPAVVEIALAAGRLDEARAAADELASIGDTMPSVYLRALAAHADAAVRLAAGEAKDAVPRLRAAWAGFREAEAPYEAARVRELIGLAYRMIGDADAAEMELDAARDAFERLEAGPDAARLGSLARRPRPAAGLSARELEVVALVAKGKTNRAIADELVISEKTVARHLNNIFAKLDVPSRAALTAYAYEHGLLSTSG